MYYLLEKIPFVLLHEDKCTLPIHIVLPFFLACNCNEEGSVDQNCNAHGKCTCKENVIGDKCDTVVEAFYDITDPKGTYTNMAIICPIKELSCNSRVINESMDLVCFKPF